MSLNPGTAATRWRWTERVEGKGPRHTRPGHPPTGHLVTASLTGSQAGHSNPRGCLQACAATTPRRKHAAGLQGPRAGRAKRAVPAAGTRDHRWATNRNGHVFLRGSTFVARPLGTWSIISNRSTSLPSAPPVHSCSAVAQPHRSRPVGVRGRSAQDGVRGRRAEPRADADRRGGRGQPSNGCLRADPLSSCGLARPTGKR